MFQILVLFMNQNFQDPATDLATCDSGFNELTFNSCECHKRNLSNVLKFPLEQLNHEQHRMKVLISCFHLKRQTSGLLPQTKKLERNYMRFDFGS